jgi:hypothetical protein
MERKGGSTAVVTTAEVATALKHARVSTLEANTLHMRHGLKVETRAPVGEAEGASDELRDELMLIELQLLKSLRAHRAADAKRTAPRNATREKIVRALRNKKK